MNNIALRTKKIAFSLAAFVVMLSAVLSTAPAHADGEYYSTWVSGTGSNANSSSGCQASAPCADFSTALAQTTTGGEVNCAGPVDYHNFNTVTITYSVTIDCHDMLGSIFTTIGSNGITINAPGSDVILRNLNLDGWAQHSSIFSGDQAANGILIQAALRVEIFNCKIMNFGQDGISDTRTTGGTELFIKSTIVRGNTGPGIVAAAAATNSVALENVQSVANAYGIAVGTGNHVTISRSVMFGNATAGVEADPGGQVYVDNTEIANNGIGVQAYGNVALGNSGIVSNTTGISGTTSSYGNNRIFANFSAGTAPTPIPQQ
jgi:hypothetical protein